MSLPDTTTGYVLHTVISQVLSQRSGLTTLPRIALRFTVLHSVTLHCTAVPTILALTDRTWIFSGGQLLMRAWIALNPDEAANKG